MTQVNKIRKERREITTDNREIQRNVGNYHEELYDKKFENLGEVDKFLETYNPQELSQEEAESLNRLMLASEIEEVIKKKQKQKQKTAGTLKPWVRQILRKILPNI